MGGDSYSSSSSSLESGDSTMGSQRELINIRGAQLYLIDGEESVLMTSGDFSLKFLKQMNSPLAVVVANVGEVQWPVGKDAPVFKVWNRRYTFALPGLVYGMIIPDSTPPVVLQHFEAILNEYSTFETHHEIANAVQFGTPGARDNSGFWTAVAPEVETLSSRVAHNIDNTSTVVASSIVMGGDWAASGIKHGASLMSKPNTARPESRSDGGVSPRMMKRMQQARRMSAVAKLMSRTLLKGAISASGHVNKVLGLDVNVASTAPAYGYPPQDDSARNVAVASVDAFGKVVEAVETAGKSLYDVTQKLGTDMVQERFGHEAGQVLQDGFGAVGNVINTAWTLNKLGVKMLLRMTAASTVLSARSKTSKSSASTVTDDQSQLGSPTSTGSMPMKRSPPQTLHHEISLSPPHQVSQSVPLHLLAPATMHSGQQLHTSQLFPTSAEHLRHHATVTPSEFMPGNYTSVVPTASRGSSPFQQYHRHIPQAPFSFQTARANMQID